MYNTCTSPLEKGFRRSLGLPKLYHRQSVLFTVLYSLVSRPTFNTPMTRHATEETASTTLRIARIGRDGRGGGAMVFFREAAFAAIAMRRVVAAAFAGCGMIVAAKLIDVVAAAAGHMRSAGVRNEAKERAGVAE